MTPTLKAAAIVALLALSSLGGCATDPDGGQTPASGPLPEAAEPPGPTGGEGVRITKLAQFPTLLTSFDATPDGAELLVGDRQGVIWRLVREARGRLVIPVLAEDPVLDLSAEVSLLGERGAFDLKVTPDGSHVIVNYTAQDGTITIERFPYQPGQAIDRSEGEVLVALPHPYSWHHGGGMAFADDGDLYVGVGDMEFRQVAPPGPQDPALILGGILRIPADAVEGEAGSWEATPADMVARGMRNPWRISFDPATGDLWIGEVGQKSKEEIDVIPHGLLGEEVVNFGWPYFEGSDDYQKGMPDGLDVVGPVLEREHDGTTCGVVGGFRYRGTLIPELGGALVYGDLCGDALRVLEVDENLAAISDRPLIDLDERIISLGRDRRGELYLLGMAGGLYRLDPDGWEVGDGSQEADDVATPSTTVPRTTLTCDNMVAAIEPLADLGSMTAPEAEAALRSTIEQFDAIIPQLAPEIYQDGVTARGAFVALLQLIEEVGWNTGGPEQDALKEQLLTGTGIFEGMPDAVARIVDSECG